MSYRLRAVAPSTLSRTLALVVVTALFSSACSRETPANPEATAPPAATPPAITAVWTATNGIEAPESAYLDAGSGFLFSSQVAGSPEAKDGNGRIVKMSADGNVIAADWVTGLNAPKGLRSCNGTLWTSDIDQVVGVEIASGKITSRVTVPNAKFLNDVACGADGTVYISDNTTSQIFAVKDGKPSVFAEGEELLEWPNGLLVDGERLIVGGWGKPPEVNGHLFAIDLKTRAKTLIAQTPVGQIDGIESDGRGGFIVTDWLAGKVMHVSATGEIKDLQTFKPGTADLAFIADKKIAIVPHMTENKVAAYDLSASLP